MYTILCRSALPTNSENQYMLLQSIFACLVVSQLYEFLRSGNTKEIRIAKDAIRSSPFTFP
jgi:hypothetical protein